MRYATRNNFVGSVVDGYQARQCILKTTAATSLQLVAQAAKTQGLKLVLFDCYRPQRAVDHFVRWVNDIEDTKTKTEYYPNLDKGVLLGDYIAEKSGHSRGYTIDLSLAQKNEQGQWQLLDMGGQFDLFDPLSNTDNPEVTAQQRANRYTLKNLMAKGNFSNYPMEWWHYTHEQDSQQTTKHYYNFPVLAY
ncbi:M15 family metallopeptidase [Neptunicella marina]|uniref:D-alanyl-D-alanine dipeptidase n=2 Tax=Neptunicella marina TaxID=2125989 RepID=A0A8J6IRV7_9ALTE|nr:M15 family metallopeptidase [Neptunicella marina]